MSFIWGIKIIFLNIQDKLLLMSPCFQSFETFQFYKHSCLEPKDGLIFSGFDCTIQYSVQCTLFCTISRCVF